MRKNRPLAWFIRIFAAPLEYVVSFCCRCLRSFIMISINPRRSNCSVLTHRAFREENDGMSRYDKRTHPTDQQQNKITHSRRVAKMRMYTLSNWYISVHSEDGWFVQEYCCRTRWCILYTDTYRLRDDVFVFASGNTTESVDIAAWKSGWIW